MFINQTDYLDGPQFATLRVRPWRLAFLIPHDGRAEAEAAIRVNCLLWGGSYNLLVPVSADGAIGDDWRRFLDAHDPDKIIDCVGVPNDERAGHKRLGREVIHWDPEQPSQFLTFTTTIYSILHASLRWLAGVRSTTSPSRSCVR